MTRPLDSREALKSERERGPHSFLIKMKLLYLPNSGHIFPLPWFFSEVSGPCSAQDDSKGTRPVPVDTGWVLLGTQSEMALERGQARSKMTLERGQATDPSPLTPWGEGHPES